MPVKNLAKFLYEKSEMKSSHKPYKAHSAGNAALAPR